MEKIIVNGAKSHDKQTDWDIGFLWFDHSLIKEIEWRKLAKFNQWSYTETTHACTMVWATREYCYQNDIEFSIWLMLDIVKYAEKNLGYTIGEWWNSSLGMNAIRKFFGNENNYVKIMYNDPIIAEIYSNNNVLWITYKGNREWNLDSSDGELTGTKFEPTTYWHRTSTQFDIDKKKVYINDSYDGSKWNVYSVPNLLELVNDVNVYPTFYYWIPKVKNEPEVKDLYKIIQWYDLTIKEMMDLYRTLKSEKQLKDRKDLLKLVGEQRRKKQKYINMLHDTQK